MEPKLIMRLVAHDFGVTVAQIQGKKRIANITIPRHVAMFLIRDMCGDSYPAIGRRFFADHSTVISACHGVRKRMAASAAFLERVTRLEKQIRAVAENNETPEPELGLCPHCHRPFIDNAQRDAAVSGIKKELQVIANRVEAFARAS